MAISPLKLRKYVAIMLIFSSLGLNFMRAEKVDVNHPQKEEKQTNRIDEERRTAINKARAEQKRIEKEQGIVVSQPHRHMLYSLMDQTYNDLMSSAVKDGAWRQVTKSSQAATAAIKMIILDLCDRLASLDRYLIAGDLPEFNAGIKRFRNEDLKEVKDKIQAILESQR